MNEVPAENDSMFLALSADLTGFDRFELQATGLAGYYRRTVDEKISPEIRERLFTVWRDRVHRQPSNQKAIALDLTIMKVPELREAALAIIVLWYVGSWYSSPMTSSVVSASAYVEGLMWRAIASHPMGAKPQGYGAWAQDAPPPPEAADAI